jgi:hypothetical protein
MQIEKIPELRPHQYTAASYPRETGRPQTCTLAWDKQGDFFYPQAWNSPLRGSNSGPEGCCRKRRPTGLASAGKVDHIVPGNGGELDDFDEEDDLDLENQD